MTRHPLHAAIAGLALIAMTAASTADAQRRPGGGGGGRPGGGGARPGGGGGARPGGGGGGLQVRSNANASVNRNANVNRNVNVNNNVNVHGGYYGGGYYRPYDDYHPLAVAAVAATTAIVIGSIVHSIPPSCSNVIVGGVAFYQCGSSWYQPRYVGTSVQYVVVTAPR